MGRSSCFFIFAFIFNLSYYVPSSLASPIIGGVPDIIFMRKYHVSVHTWVAGLDKFVCSGTIIHEKFVLTAAQCFFKSNPSGLTKTDNWDESRVLVSAGTNRRKIDRGNEVTSIVSNILIPKDYQSHPHFQADVAVLKLTTSLQGPNIKHVTVDQARGAVASFCGFGYYEGTTNDNGLFVINQVFSEIIRCLSVTISGHSQHQSGHTYLEAIVPPRSELYTACPGDKGAGLIRGDKIVGILTGKLYACVPHEEPLKFTNLGDLRSLIEKAMNLETDDHQLHSHFYVL